MVVWTGAGYLWWLVRREWRKALLGGLWGTLWAVGTMLPPYLLARGIDDGLRAHDPAALVFFSAALLGLGALNALFAILRHRTMSLLRLSSTLRTVRLLTAHVSRLGGTLPARVGAGEVVSVGSTDATTISQTLTIAGPGIGSVAAYFVVAVLLLSISPVLGLVILLGVPVLLGTLGPLLRRLPVTQAEYRARQGRLTARTGDIVAGLRVLGGLGGADAFAARYRTASGELRDEGYRVGAVASWIDALQVGLPALFLAAVTWLAATMAADGQITVGELVAVYGYVALLVMPVSQFIEGGGDLVRGLVAARRVTAVLNLAPEVAERADPVAAPRCPAPLHDPVSGVTLAPGEFVALVAARTADSAAVAHRLGRLTDSAARWGDVPVTEVRLAELRSRVVLAEHDAFLFAGPLRDTLGAHAAAALRTAAAEDIVDGLPDGLDSIVDTQARTLSGGQRQRVRLARALGTGAEALLLVEPTSAVDANTEALIYHRLRTARAGLATLVVGTSPLLLDAADRVGYLVDGVLADTGTHAELLHRLPGYRALVFRGSAGEHA